MGKKSFTIVLWMIILAIVIIAICVIVNNYNLNKPVNPNNNIQELSESDMLKVKEKYNIDGKKEEFLNICEAIELAVTNRFLDGTVTNEEELAVVISEINDMLKTSDWTMFEIEYPTYWMGNWELDKMGILHFTFKYEEIKPNWANDEEVARYIN